MKSQKKNKTPKNCIIHAKYGNGTVRYFKNKSGHDFTGYTTKEGKNVYRRVFKLEVLYLKYFKKINYYV